MRLEICIYYYYHYQHHHHYNHHQHSIIIIIIVIIMITKVNSELSYSVDVIEEVIVAVWPVTSCHTDHQLGHLVPNERRHV